MKINGKIHLVFVCGIRTHYIKAYALKQVLKTIKSDIISHFKFSFIDAKQHYDVVLHDDFINELDLRFDYTLSHNTTNREELWSIILKQLSTLYNEINQNDPISYIVVFGDVITTVLGAISAMFSGYKIIHIESGTRVINGKSIEEKCRRLVDHISNIRFSSNNKDLAFLRAEGLSNNSYFSGDLIYDYIYHFSLSQNSQTNTIKAEIINTDSEYINYSYNSIKGRFDLNQRYIIVSLHHKDNQDSQIIQNLLDVLCQYDFIVFYIIHPNMKKFFPPSVFYDKKHVFADHVPYIDNLKLIKNSMFIITDSGGIQREAFYYNKRCIVRSYSTVWEDIVRKGSNRISGCQIYEIEESIKWAYDSMDIPYIYDNSFGDGYAVEKILKTILQIEKDNKSENN